VVSLFPSRMWLPSFLRARKRSFSPFLFPLRGNGKECLACPVFLFPKTWFRSSPPQKTPPPPPPTKNPHPPPPPPPPFSIISLRPPLMKKIEGHSYSSSSLPPQASEKRSFSLPPPLFFCRRWKVLPLFLYAKRKFFFFSTSETKLFPLFFRKEAPFLYPLFPFHSSSSSLAWRIIKASAPSFSPPPEFFLPSPPSPKN